MFWCISKTIKIQQRFFECMYHSYICLSFIFKDGCHHSFSHFFSRESTETRSRKQETSFGAHSLLSALELEWVHSWSILKTLVVPSHHSLWCVHSFAIIHFISDVSLNLIEMIYKNKLCRQHNIAYSIGNYSDDKQYHMYYQGKNFTGTSHQAAYIF